MFHISSRVVSRYNLHITCSCGRYAYLAAENVPATA